MANRVGVQIRRTTAGPISAGPDPGDLLFVALVAERGPINVPTLITSMSRFQTVFGGATPIGSETKASSGYLNLRDFFAGGGRRAVVLRIAGGDAVAADVMLQDRAGAPLDTLNVTGKGPGTWGNDLDIVIADGTKADTFKLTILDGDGDTLETWDNLKMDSASMATVNNGSSYVVLENQDSVTAAPDNRPATGTFNLGDTTAGVDDNEPSPAEIVGTETDGVKTGLKAFKTKSFRRGIYILPDLDDDSTVCDEIATHLEEYWRLHFTSTAAGDNVAAARTRRDDLGSFAQALYYPRVLAEDPFTGQITNYPYLGRIVADYFRVIELKGPAKAPAGKDFTVKGVRGLETQANGQPLVDSGVAEDLVGRGINPIWNRTGSGAAVWGGRAASDETNWQYVHQAYLWLRIAERCDVAIDQFVYEVVDESFDTDFFYRQIRQTIRGVLKNLHALGAFSGIVPNDGEEEDPENHAFAVRCDESLLTAVDKQNGTLKWEAWFIDALTGETIIGTVAKRTQQ